MNHPLTNAMSEITMLEERCRQQAARIEALESLSRIDASVRAKFLNRIEMLETTLREIEWHDPKSPAAAAARTALGGVK
jgi:hypothetical protein